MGDSPAHCWICGKPTVPRSPLCATHEELAGKCPAQDGYMDARRAVGNRTDRVDEATWRVLRDIGEAHPL